MERLDGLLSGIRDSGLSVPDLPLPRSGDPDIVLVAATLLFGLGLTGLVMAWVDRRLSVASAGTFLLSIMMFVWMAGTLDDPVGPIRISEAFVEVLARILR